MFYIWQGPGSPHFHIVTFLCPILNPSCANGTPTVIYQTTSPDFTEHTVKVTKSGTAYSLYLDDVHLFDSAPTTRVASNIWFGHPQTTSTSGTWASLSIDYLKIGTPPTPTFPYLSQKNPLWASELYDSANVWAPLGQDGIDRWGCAITSVAMILREYGVKAHDGTDVDPSKLNTWLKTQPDGYIGPGLLNWMAVTRYAKVSYEAGHADTKLEYTRSYSPSTPTLPAILGVPGHFVVAHDEDITNWTIHDPANQAITALPKTATLRSINTFTPSLTDMSYMLFVSEQGDNITLMDQLGNPVVLEWVSEYLTDDLGGGSTPTIQTAMLPKPDDGVYKLTVINDENTPREIDTYLYDEEGDVMPDNLVVPPHTTATFAINYSSAPNMNGPIALDYAPIFDYLKNLRKPKSSANGIFQALYVRFLDLVGNNTAGTTLTKFITQQSPKHIDPLVKTKLQNYVMLIEQN